MNPIAAKALELFSKKFGRQILKSAADNKWVADMIKKLKAPPKQGALFNMANLKIIEVFKLLSLKI